MTESVTDEGSFVGSVVEVEGATLVDKFAYVVTVTPAGSLLVNGAPAAPGDDDSSSSEELLAWALDQVRCQWEIAGASAGHGSMLTVTIDDQRPGGYGRHRTRLRPGQAASIEGLRARTGKNLEHWTPGPTNGRAPEPAGNVNRSTSSNGTSGTAPITLRSNGTQPRPIGDGHNGDGPNGDGHNGDGPNGLDRTLPQQHWSVPAPSSPLSPRSGDHPTAPMHPEAPSAELSAPVTTAHPVAAATSTDSEPAATPRGLGLLSRADRPARSKKPAKASNPPDAGTAQRKSALGALLRPSRAGSKSEASPVADLDSPPRPGWTRYQPRIARPKLPEPEKAAPKQRESPVKMIMVIAATLLVAVLAFSIYQRAVRPDSYAAVCVDQRTAARVNTDAPCRQGQVAYFRWWYVPAGSAVPAVGAPIDHQQGSFIEPGDHAPVRYGFAAGGGVYKQPTG